MSTKQSAVALHSSNGHSVSAEPTLSQIFGSNVFSDREMKKRLPKNTYAALRR
jgi:glutamine synthetase type III